MIKISIIICTYNRSEILWHCLDSLTRQSVKDDLFEVIVVVDGSSDGTSELLTSFEAPYQLHSVIQSNCGKLWKNRLKRFLYPKEYW